AGRRARGGGGATWRGRPGAGAGCGGAPTAGPGALPRGGGGAATPRPAPPPRASRRGRTDRSAQSGEEVVLGHGGAGRVLDPHEGLHAHQLGEPLLAHLEEEDVLALTGVRGQRVRSEEHTSELQSRENLVCP